MPLVDVKSSLKLTAINALLVGNAFVWYLLVFKTLGILLEHIGVSNLSPAGLLVFGVNAISLALLAFVGSFVVDKFKNRTNFLSIWMLVGVFISLIPFVLDLSSIASVLIISGLFGSYFGIGMPAVMGYFSAHTSNENRAKVSGVTFLLIGFLFAILGSFIISDVAIACLVLSAIRLFGFLIFRGIKSKKQVIQETPAGSYLSILSNKPFIFYFISWCMLSLVNYMTVPIQNALFSSSETYIFLIYILENIIMAIAAVVCGFVADIFGRKRLTIIGFIMLGIGYSILGLFPNVLLAGYFYVISDGIAWGIFNIVFLMIIWGDLAQAKNSDKLYFLGALPYVLSSFLRMLFAFYVPDISRIPIFSFASVFLFLAVLPLLYAPETLSEKLMKERELKSYVENAKKKAQKETEKAHKKDKPKNLQPEEEPQEPKNSKEYDDAVKLAEKYY